MASHKSRELVHLQEKCKLKAKKVRLRKDLLFFPEKKSIF